MVKSLKTKIVARASRITGNPMILINQYKGRLDSLGEEELYHILDIQLKHNSNQEISQACDEVASAILDRLPGLVGKDPDYLRLNYPSSSEEIRQ
jgi:hypothetical protein